MLDRAEENELNDKISKQVRGMKVETMSKEDYEKLVGAFRCKGVDRIVFPKPSSADTYKAVLQATRDVFDIQNLNRDVMIEAVRAATKIALDDEAR